MDDSCASRTAWIAFWRNNHANALDRPKTRWAARDNAESKDFRREVGGLAKMRRSQQGDFFESARHMERFAAGQTGYIAGISLNFPSNFSGACVAHKWTTAARTPCYRTYAQFATLICTNSGVENG